MVMSKENLDFELRTERILLPPILDHKIAIYISQKLSAGVYSVHAVTALLSGDCYIT